MVLPQNNSGREARRSDRVEATPTGPRLIAMKSLLALLLLTLLCRPAAAAPAEDAFAANRRLGRGVNIIGYDPLWRSRDQAHFQDKHFRQLKEAGFNSVRINLHPFRHMGPAPDHPLPAAWWETLDWAVKGARANGLVAVLDFHEFTTMGEAPEANHGKFLAFWRQLAAHTQSQPPEVMFEILNEPNKKLTPALWNQYLREALAVIRPAHPTRTVIVGPAFWNSIDHLAELELPADDAHLIVTVHYYKPMGFTHQGAPWNENRDKSGVTWTASEAERQAVQQDFARAEAWAREHHRPLYLGEFGAYDKAPMESRVRYTDYVARTAEGLGWSWAYWQFDSDFILWDMKRDTWVEPILHALIPPAK